MQRGISLWGSASFFVSRAFFKMLMRQKGSDLTGAFAYFLRIELRDIQEVLIMVFDTVKTILAEQLDANEDDITLETSVIDDLGADSLDVVDIIMSLEEEFDLEVPDEDIETIKTVGDLVKYIEDHTDSE